MAVNPKTELTVNEYKVIPLPSNADLAGLLQYLAQETRRLSITLQTLVDAANQATDVAPLNPRNGMIRYAEGAWAAILGATGLYVYKAGAWTHIV